jgi:hypothetical protein
MSNPKEVGEYEQEKGETDFQRILQPRYVEKNQSCDK